MDTDASGVGIGCALSQVQEGKERIIAYHSRTQQKTHRNYCVKRKYCSRSSQQWGLFITILRRRFLVRRDHPSRQWLLQFKNPESQTARWLQKLQEYDFEVIHRADALSRMPRPCLQSKCGHCIRNEQRDEDTTKTVRVVRCTDAESKSLREKQLADPTIASVLKWVQLGRRSS